MEKIALGYVCVWLVWLAIEDYYMLSVVLWRLCMGGLVLFMKMWEGNYVLAGLFGGLLILPVKQVGKADVFVLFILSVAYDCMEYVILLTGIVSFVQHILCKNAVQPLLPAIAGSFCLVRLVCWMID